MSDNSSPHLARTTAQQISRYNPVVKFLINTPAKRGSTRGNRITAERWGRILRSLQHTVTITDQYNPSSQSHRADCLVALHAVRSAEAMVQFREHCPGRPILLCLTGTDVHRDLAGDRGPESRLVAIESLGIADHIILIEPECRKRLPARFRNKTYVIYQSASPVRNRPSPLKTSFEVSVIGHLRDEKDPLLAARAARRLPTASRIRITQIGAALTNEYQVAAERESRKNPRYHWMGARSHGVTQRLLARSCLTVLTSRIEGGPSVLAEAVVNGVPILSTRIDATIGMLNGDYPGFFDVGDEEALSQMLLRAETDRQFFYQLEKATNRLGPRFHPDAERASWQKFLRRVTDRL